MVAAMLLAFHQVDSSLYLQDIVAQCVYMLHDVRDPFLFRSYTSKRKQVEGVEKSLAIDEASSRRAEIGEGHEWRA